MRPFWGAPGWGLATRKLSMTRSEELSAAFPSSSRTGWKWSVISQVRKLPEKPRSRVGIAAGW